MTDAALYTAQDVRVDNGREPSPNPLRRWSIVILGLAVLIAGSSAFAPRAEAGSCTGIALIEGPLLPVIV